MRYHLSYPGLDIFLMCSDVLFVICLLENLWKKNQLLLSFNSHFYTQQEPVCVIIFWYKQKSKFIMNILVLESFPKSDDSTVLKLLVISTLTGLSIKMSLRVRHCLNAFPTYLKNTVCVCVCVCVWRDFLTRNNRKKTYLCSHMFNMRYYLD